MTKALDDINKRQNQQDGNGVFNLTNLEHSGTMQSQAVRTAVEKENKPITTYSEMYERLNPQPSDEERAKEYKRQRRNAVIAAIGDGISALANLYYTGKGAPNSYDPKLGLSAKLQERYDKINAERKAHDREWRAGYVRAQALDRQAENDRNRWKLYRRRLDAEQEKWQKEQEVKAAAQAAKEEAKKKDQQIAQQNADTRKQVATDRAAGRGGYARGSRGGGSSSNTTTETYDKNGNLKKTVVKKSGAQRPQGNRRQGSLLPGQTGKGGLLPKK